MALTAAWHKYDAIVSRFVFDGLRRVGLQEIQGHPSVITAHLPFIASPTPQVTFVLAYLLIVVCGVAALRTRKSSAPREDPAWLRLLVQAHNLVLISLSAYMSSAACYYAWKYGYRFWGTNYSPKERDMGGLIYTFYVSKLYEFVDTLIMLLKGKVEQVSFLHVYHHASISTIWWAIAYVAPGGDAWYCCFLNSLVHVLMYTYYLLATLLGKDAKARRKYLWWGRYLTQFQMFQFVTMMLEAAYTWAYSPYPKFLSKLLFFYMITLLALFANFYAQKHGSSRAAKQKLQ
uniref:Delta-6 polyunsaturated fatty acid elongase n=1 Tax=Lobosphaera incisa TaxID=312850 RepID=B8YJJ0_9CHLO|nr:delta-6 polyunsaturated fatty acid elongase [Lobosphaera incisa]